MKLLLCAVGVFLLALSAASANQQTENPDACRFKILGPSDSTTKVAVTGPEDIVAMTHVVEQPDSPVEILAIDFKDSFISVVNEHFTHQLNCTAKIYNRSDQPIRGVGITLLVGTETGGPSGAGMMSPVQGPSLAPGHQLEISACGGNGAGGAPNNHVRVLVFVNNVATNDCSYYPSQRYPRPFGGS
jgi:hypothetical protein